MARNDAFSKLKVEEDDAFKRKQAAYQAYRTAQQKVAQLDQEQQTAWEEYIRAKEKMDQEYDSMQAQKDAIWDEYKRIRDNNNRRIEILKPQADNLYHMMSTAFSNATDAYSYGSKADASLYSAEGKAYQEQLKSLNSQISSLAQEVKSAKQSAQTRSNTVSNSAFHAAQQDFKNAKAAHRSSLQAYKAAKSERNRLHVEFKQLHQLHLSKKAAVQDAKRQQRDERIAQEYNNHALMVRAGVPYCYQQECKVVTEADGTINFYFGGFGKEDGLWHGHISMDNLGHVTYIRMPTEEHGAEHFTDDPALNDFDRQKHGRKWGPVTYAWVDDGTEPHPVTLQEGLDGTDREGHTLIADGFVPGDEFAKPGAHNHNHYGKNVIPGRSGRVEDPENGGDRGKYTGPGR